MPLLVFFPFQGGTNPSNPASSCAKRSTSSCAKRSNSSRDGSGEPALFPCELHRLFLCGPQGRGVSVTRVVPLMRFVEAFLLGARGEERRRPCLLLLHPAMLFLVAGRPHRLLTSAPLQAALASPRDSSATPRDPRPGPAGSGLGADLGQLQGVQGRAGPAGVPKPSGFIQTQHPAGPAWASSA